LSIYHNNKNGNKCAKYYIQISTVSALDFLEQQSPVQPIQSFRPQDEKITTS